MDNSLINANGRVDILSPIGNNLNFADKIPIKECSSYRDALIGTWIDSNLSCAYFSVQNIQNLQNSIIKGVFDKSNRQFHIGHQDCDELKIIMRSIYLQHADNLPTDIPEQIQTLNDLVLDYAIPQVYNEAIGYLKYKRDASTIYTIPPHPTFSSSRDRLVELTNFFT